MDESGNGDANHAATAGSYVDAIHDDSATVPYEDDSATVPYESGSGGEHPAAKSTTSKMALSFAEHERPVICALKMGSPHWSQLIHQYPFFLNCCVDVRYAFGPVTEQDHAHEWKDDFSTRNKLRKKQAWLVLWEACKCVLDDFGLLVLVCNDGKVRSVILGTELASQLNCHFCNPLDPGWKRYALPRLSLHGKNYKDSQHSIVGIGVCEEGWRPEEWMDDLVRRGNEAALDEEAVCPFKKDATCGLGQSWKESLHAFHELQEGDVVIARNIPKWRSLEDLGWGFGTVVRGNWCAWEHRWYPIKRVLIANIYYDEHPNEANALRSETMRQIHDCVLGQWIYHKEWFERICVDVEHNEYKAALKEKNQARSAALDSVALRDVPDELAIKAESAIEVFDLNQQCWFTPYCR